MTRAELIAFLQETRLAVQASVHPDGAPQAAVVGVAVTDQLELVFDTLMTSRKYDNLRRDPRCAITWWAAATTVQIEGTADLPTGAELDRLRASYLATFPDGHERITDPAIAYVRIRPSWIRVSDFATVPPKVFEVPA
ncbi:MAG: pyridoxamine 5'-phosphate oxidase family protein [Deltaproteobacteria bacterium]|nr:pyridoxamine 5'-phosphate oxidase family protein [Deltaproteobacteria bacterium]